MYMYVLSSTLLFVVVLLLLTPKTFSFTSSKSSLSPVRKSLTYTEASLAELRAQRTKLWEKSNSDNNLANGDSSDETVKKYGLEMGILKTYFDKSSKVKPKDLISRYGIAYFGTSITLAIISYALCYVLIANGVDVGSLLQKIGIKPSEAAVSAGTGGLAYAVHKAASPIRFVPTIILTPIVAKWMGKKPKEDSEGESGDSASER